MSKLLTELFFAYSRDKYEVVSTNALADSYTYPSEIIEEFKNGQWTVSVKGRPFHSLALDEAHECIINRKLKQITTRPSHFRMVELSDFMAYLDTVTSGLDSHVFKHHKIKDYTKKTSCTRANILYRLIKEKKVFSDILNTRKLYNLFVDSPPPPPELLAANVEDLLQFPQ